MNEEKEEINTVLASLFMLAFTSIIIITTLSTSFKINESDGFQKEDITQEQTNYLSDQEITRLKSICNAQTIDKNKKVQVAMEYSRMKNLEYFDIDKNKVFQTYCDPDISPYGY